MGIFEAFEQDIAGPIGMEDWSASDGSFYFESEKSLYPAYPFRMTAMDMARFGQLYLQNGHWKGQQIVPSNWISASTRAHTILDPEMGTGYGMMWAIIPEDDLMGTGGGYYHTGIGVHMLIVLPEKNLVIVHRVNTDESWTMTDDDYFPLVQAIMDAKVY